MIALDSKKRLLIFSVPESLAKLKTYVDSPISISPGFMVDFPIGCNPYIEIDEESKAVLLALHFGMLRYVKVHSLGTLSKKSQLNFELIQREFE